MLFPLWSVVVNGARQKREKALKNALYTDLTDNVMGISDWIFSQRGQDYVQLHEASQTDLQAVQQQMRHFHHVRSLLFELVFGLLVVLTIIWTSMTFSGDHGGQANWIAAFVLSVFPLVDAFAGLSVASQETNVYADSISRLNDLPHPKESETQALSPQVPLDFHIENLTFRYGSEEKKSWITLVWTLRLVRN